MERTIRPAVLILCLSAVFLLAGAVSRAADREQLSPPAGEVRGFSHQYTIQEKAFIAATPEIRVSNEFDWPPFDFMASGQPAGFGIDLMNLLAEKSGLHFTYVNGYTWDELTQMFFDGKLDVLHSLSITPERQKKAFFSAPYYHSKNVMIFRADTRNIATLHDLEDRIIALPRGWSSIEFFQTYFPGVHIIEVENSREALEYVDQGKVAATVEQEGIAQYFITKYGFTDLTLSKWIDNDELQKTSSMHFAVLKTNPVLFSILDKALASITLDEMRELKERWFSRAGRSIGADDPGLSPDEHKWLTAKKKLFYCLARDRMPYSDTNGPQPMGIVPDLMEVFSERLGLSMEPYPVAHVRQGLAALEKGACDLFPLASRTPERKTVFEFTTDYTGYNVAIITREETPFISGIPALSTLRTGLVPDGNIFDKVMAAYPGLKYTPVPSVLECLEQVSAGQLDAAVLSLPMAAHYIRHNGLTNLKVAGHTDIKEDLRMAVARENAPLHTIISKVARSLNKQEQEAIENRWMALEMKEAADYTLLWQGLGGAGIALVIVVLWNRKLARLNREIGSANQKLKDKTRELEIISITDSLTGLHNRRHVEMQFELELKRTVRHHHDLTVMLIDIDFFKAINDTYGHQTGDQVLVEFSDLLKTSIRRTDILGRWGGEEFIIVCPEITIENGGLMARGLCRKIAATPFGEAGTQTASFGVTAYKKGDDVQSMILRADKALYQAKARGRNRVESLV